MTVPKFLVLPPKDKLRSTIFNAIHNLIINQILLQAEQSTLEEFKFEKQRRLKEIYESYQDLLKKCKYRLSKETIQEMVDNVLDLDEFIPELQTEYLTGTEEEKDKIVQQLDCEKLNQETFALVTSYLKKKGGLKKKKGFGSL